MAKPQKIKANRGFTLIELLVVISIISFLASIILVAAQSARARGRDGKRIGDISQLSKALELYYNDNNGYPTATNGGAGYAGAGGIALTAQNVQGLVPKYMTQMPAPTEPADGNCIDTNTAYPSLNNIYWYQSDNQPTFSPKYTVTFCLGNGLGGSLGAGAHYLIGGALH